MRIYGKYLFVGYIFGIIFSVYGTLHMAGLNIIPVASELAVSMGFGQLGGCSVEASAKYMVELIPYFVFIMIFTTYIYRHFCYSSVYIFSRCEHRVKWMLGEISKLSIYSVLFVLSIVCGRLTPQLLFSKLIFDKIGLILLIHFVLLMTIWIFSNSLLGNVISMIWGSQIGTSIVCILQTICVMALAFIDDVNLQGIEIFKLRINPMAHLVIEWHNLKGYTGEYLNTLSYSLSFVESYVCLVLILVLCIFGGIIFIKKTDIVLDNKEI